MCSGTVTSSMVLVAVVHYLRLTMVGSEDRWGDLGCVSDVASITITVKCFLRMGFVPANSL